MYLNQVWCRHELRSKIKWFFQTNSHCVLSQRVHRPLTIQCRRGFPRGSIHHCQHRAPAPPSRSSSFSGIALQSDNACCVQMSILKIITIKKQKPTVKDNIEVGLNKILLLGVCINAVVVARVAVFDRVYLVGVWICGLLFSVKIIHETFKQMMILDQ